MTVHRASPPAATEGFLARAFWLHPLLAGVAPVLLLFRQAKDLLGPLDSWPLLALFAAAGAVLLGAFALVYREARWAALAASTVLVALHVLPGLPAAAWPYAWAGVALLLAAMFWLRRVRLGWPTALANAFVLVWTLLGVWQCVRDGRAADRAPVVVERPLPAVAPAPSPDERPDIYVLLLDGYGRADTLEERLGFRPALADELGARGFLVGTGTVAPHAQTALSLGALFGLDTIDHLVTDTATTNRRPLRRLVDDGALVRLLRASGYRIVVVPGEFAGTRLAGADERRSAGCLLDEFDYHLVAHTAIPTLFDWAGLPPHALTHAHRRACLKTELERFAEPPTGAAPAFVFAHLVAPHPPFVFRPDGSARPTRAGSLADGPGFADGFAEDYAAGYRDQSAWLDREVTATVDRLLAGARRPPIVFVLGDHGAAEDLDWTHPTDAQLRERMCMLSAVLVPDEVRRELTPATGPVDVMRRIVSQVTGAALPPLPQRSLFSSWHTPYEFRDVTAIVQPPSDATLPPPAAPAAEAP